MRFDNEINQASKITLVFTTITSIFALLEKLITLLPMFDNINPKLSIENFFKVNIAWFIAILLIILGLCFYLKKVDSKFNLTFLHNPMIRLTAGLLIIFEGIIDLTTKVPVLTLNIQTFQQAKSMLGDKFDDIINYSLISDAIQILIYLLQILLGLFFVLYKKKNKENIEYKA